MLYDCCNKFSVHSFCHLEDEEEEPHAMNQSILYNNGNNLNHLFCLVMLASILSASADYYYGSIICLKCQGFVY